MKRYVVGLVVLLLGLLAPGLALAQERAIRWERYDITVDVRPNGDLRFTETQRLVVDQGEFRFGARSFDTGERGQVRDVSVSESGQEFRPGQDVPGAYSGADDGEQFRLTYYFLDPTARTHDITVSYTVARSLIPAGEQVRLEWPFYCAAQCPRIDSGAVTIRVPGNAGPAAVDASAAGVEARQTAEGSTIRWELAQPIQNEQLLVTMAFPSALLSPGAELRSANNRPVEQPPVQGRPIPETAPIPNIAPAAPGFSGMFCVIVLFMLFFAFSVIRGSAGRRVYRNPRPPLGGPLRRGGFGGPLGRGGLGGPLGGGMFGGGPFGMPGRRRFRGRGFGGWGGGWGLPPIIIPPPFPPHDHSGGPFNPPGDMSPGGNAPQDESFGSGGTWDDSFGSGGGWSDSFGSGGGWGGAGGSGGGWGDSGGGSSWGGGGGGDSGGGGGNNDSSSFG